jgi:ABC-2 type transport system permease protein
VITVFSASGLGLLLGSFGLIVTDMNFIMNLASMGLLALSGANFPIEKFPEFIQKICLLLPMTRGIKASRMIAAGQDMSSVSYLLLGELLVGAVYITAGYIMMNIMEKQARIKGNIELF